MDSSPAPPGSLPAPAPAPGQDSLLLCHSLQEFYVGLTGAGSPHLPSDHGLDLTGLPLTDIEETYTSSLFQVLVCTEHEQMKSIKVL